MMSRKRVDFLLFLMDMNEKHFCWAERRARMRLLVAFLLPAASLSVDRARCRLIFLSYFIVGDLIIFVQYWYIVISTFCTFALTPYQTRTRTRTGGKAGIDRYTRARARARAHAVQAGKTPTVLLL